MNIRHRTAKVKCFMILLEVVTLIYKPNFFAEVSKLI